MMIKIIIPFRAISINSMYCLDRRHGLKASAREWTYQVNNILQNYQKEFTEFKSKFDKKSHGIKLEITHYYNNFYNLNGEISSKVFDLSNTEKLLMDLVIDEAHHGKPPYKSPNLCLNDKYIIELISKKLPADKDSVYITISILELSH